MEKYKNSKVDMSGITENHIQTLFQTLADIVGEKDGFEAKVTVRKK